MLDKHASAAASYSTPGKTFSLEQNRLELQGGSIWTADTWITGGLQASLEMVVEHLDIENAEGFRFLDNISATVRWRHQLKTGSFLDLYLESHARFSEGGGLVDGVISLHRGALKEGSRVDYVTPAFVARHGNVEVTGPAHVQATRSASGVLDILFTSEQLVARSTRDGARATVRRSTLRMKAERKKGAVSFRWLENSLRVDRIETDDVAPWLRQLQVDRWPHRKRRPRPEPKPGVDRAIRFETMAAPMTLGLGDRDQGHRLVFTLLGVTSLKPGG